MSTLNGKTGLIFGVVFICLLTIANLGVAVKQIFSGFSTKGETKAMLEAAKAEISDKRNLEIEKLALRIEKTIDQVEARLNLRLDRIEKNVDSE